MHTNMICKTIRSHGTGQGANALSMYFYPGVYFFKKGTLSEYKYFLINYLGSVKTKVKERPAFKRIFPIILNRLFRKFCPVPHFISQVTPMVYTLCTVNHTHAHQVRICHHNTDNVCTDTHC